MEAGREEATAAVARATAREAARLVDAGAAKMAAAAVKAGFQVVATVVAAMAGGPLVEAADGAACQ
jgi:hypothetical protein